MYTPYCSRHFTTHVDPVSKARIAVLSTHVAPIQQGFYFVNSGWSDDGRYLWFYCAFPPAPGHSVAVIDFLTDEIHHFPETASIDSWLVDPKTGNLFWGCTQGIYMRTPNPQDRPIQIAQMPERFRTTGVRGAGTHLTFTADRKEILADIQTPLGSSIGTFDIATGTYTQWYETDGIPYNHAQMNPVNNDICMCAHEYTYDPKVGDYVAPAMVDGVYPRLQIISRAGVRKMLVPVGNYATHEWWAPNGKSVYYCNSEYVENGESVSIISRDCLDGKGGSIVCRVKIPGGTGTWHSHCSKDEKYFVMDGSYPYGALTWWRGCESMVHFYNTETGKLFRFLTKNPSVEGWTPENPSIYHIDAHPRFVLNDTMISFTTTICGRVDVALVSVDQLIEATK